MKKFSLQKIIYFIAGLFFISFAASITVTFIQFKNLREQSDDMIKLISTKSDSERLQLHVSQVQQFVTDAALTFDEGSMDEAKDNQKSAHEVIDKLAVYHTDDVELLNEIRSSVDFVVTAGTKMVVAYKTQGKEAGNKEMKDPVGGLDVMSVKCFEKVQAFIKKVQDDVDGGILQMHEQERKAQVYSILTGILMMGFVFSALWTVLKRILTIPELSDQLTSETETLDESSKELFKISSHLTDQVSQQASAIEQSATALEEITSMLKKTELESANLAEEASANEDVSRKGHNSFEQVNQSIKGLQSSLEMVTVEFRKGNQELSGIIDLVKEIEQKTKVINDIVFQTKLLSFNASVEAARAGEAGKGFSVVAEEIAQLANLSGKSSQEINHLLGVSTQKISEIIRNSTHNLEKIIASNQDQLSESVDYLKDGSKYFTEVLEHSESFSQRSVGIMSALKEQMRGVEEINKAIASLQSVSQETSQSTQRSDQISKDLRSGAEHLAEVSQSLSGAVMGRAG